MQATIGLHEENGVGDWLISKFNRMFGKRTDGAPHGHGPVSSPWFINNAMPKDDSLGLHVASMANEWSIRKRRPVRRKNIAPLLKRLEADLAIDLNVDGAFLEMAEYGPWTMVFVDRTPLVIELFDEEGKGASRKPSKSSSVGPSPNAKDPCAESVGKSKRWRRLKLWKAS